jgi:hypothetical protein
MAQSTIRVVLRRDINNSDSFQRRKTIRVVLRRDINNSDSFQRRKKSGFDTHFRGFHHFTMSSAGDSNFYHLFLPMNIKHFVALFAIYIYHVGGVTCGNAIAQVGNCCCFSLTVNSNHQFRWGQLCSLDNITIDLMV